MGLVINTNTSAFNTSRVLRRSTRQLNRSLERLSSGLRINSARDDAAGLAFAETLRVSVRGLNVAIRNLQDGISLVQTAEGGLGEMMNILQRIRELAVQSANGTNTNTNRSSLQLEVNELKQQLDFIANNTEFNGVNLLNGSTPSLTIQAGAFNGQIIVITLPSMTNASTGAADIDISTVNGAQSSIGNADGVLAFLALSRANLGAFQNRFEFTINAAAIQAENSAASESFVRDANIATETIEFTRSQILVSAGTFVLAQANLVPQSALQLLT